MSAAQQAAVVGQMGRYITQSMSADRDQAAWSVFIMPRTRIHHGLCSSATSASRHLIGARELALLPEGAALVNIARGALVDTAALGEALAQGRLVGAGLDVTEPEPLPADHPLWREPRCLITSHSADTPEMTAPLLAQRITENVRGFLGDGRFVGLVDPEAGY